MKPIISIIMPMYGVEAYIGRAIESVRLQTFIDWELLIVNDGTKDRSREIAAEYEKQDNRIHIIDKPNGGLTSARLKGFEFVQGEYVSFIDSDDTLQPEYLKVLYSNIQKYQADISMCSYNTVHGDRVTPCSLYFSNTTTVLEGEEIFRDYFLPQVVSSKKRSSFLPSFMWLRLFRREVVTADLFVSERMVYQEDLAFSARLFKRLKRVVVANIPLYDYYVNAGSLTQKYRENAWKMMQALMFEIENAFEGYPKALTDERMRSCILGAIHFTLMNAARKDYDFFKNEFNSILKDPKAKCAICEVSLFQIKQAFLVMVLSLRVHCPYVIYKYNITRV